jgi:meso-butanediol dehydrogenase/(S,S)-butanediol dehydrogenase/diacetyl reductase
MTGRMAGRRALVWGGGTGLGLACAEAFAREGAKVFLSGRRIEPLRAACERLGRDRAGFEPGDITSEADVDRVTAAARSFLGGIDTLLLSSGVSSKGSIFEAKAADVRHVLETNVTSVFLATHAAANDLVASGDGSVIAIASVTGVAGMRERVAYCASKAAVIGMVRAMALDFGDKGVRVNAISPSLIMTDLARAMIGREKDPEAVLAARRAQHPLGKLGEPDDIGEAAVYLASRESKWVTGQNFVIDGGMTIV